MMWNKCSYSLRTLHAVKGVVRFKLNYKWRKTFNQVPFKVLGIKGNQELAQSFLQTFLFLTISTPKNNKFSIVKKYIK